MSLDDVCHDPVLTAARLHEQIGRVNTGSIPVEKIALNLDITKIRKNEITNFEGGLITNSNRTHGEIIVNAAGGLNRQRYTIAHELYHYLNHYHDTMTDDGFICSSGDMINRFTQTNPRHCQQERQANLFAIEFLAPRYRVQPYLKKPPCLAHINEMGKSLRVSKEAIARRYIDLHSDPIEIVFSKNDRLRCILRSKSCPYITLQPKQQLVFLPTTKMIGSSTPWQVINIPNSTGAKTTSYLAQTLPKQNRYAMTLIRLDL